MTLAMHRILANPSSITIVIASSSVSRFHLETPRDRPGAPSDTGTAGIFAMQRLRAACNHAAERHR